MATNFKKFIYIIFILEIISIHSKVDTIRIEDACQFIEKIVEVLYDDLISTSVELDVLKRESEQLVQEYYRKKPCSGRAPRSIACGAVYTVCKLHDYNVTQRQIARAGGKQDYTVRHAYYDLVNTLSLG